MMTAQKRSAITSDGALKRQEKQSRNKLTCNHNKSERETTNKMTRYEPANLDNTHKITHGRMRAHIPSPPTHRFISDFLILFCFCFFCFCFWPTVKRNICTKIKKTCTCYVYYYPGVTYIFPIANTRSKGEIIKLAPGVYLTPFHPGGETHNSLNVFHH